MKTLHMLLALFALLSIAAVAHGMQVVYINHHPMVSLREFGDTFDAAIDCDDGRNAITIAVGDRRVEMAPYSRMAWVDNCQVALDAPVVIVDDVTFVPLPFLCDTFGFTCNCNDADRQVVIVNPRTTTRFVFALDFAWVSHPHVWCYHYSCHDYFGYRHTTVVVAPRHDGWDHRSVSGTIVHTLPSYHRPYNVSGTVYHRVPQQTTSSWHGSYSSHTSYSQHSYISSRTRSYSYSNSRTGNSRQPNRQHSANQKDHGNNR